ncbi:MAG: LacI family DNA-binding transcriptional regulator [Anaerolineales bacterium]|jgi:LacI family transcriptional regulator
MSKRVTLADVAKEAGVSPQTVSRAINDKGEISTETKERILEIAQRLGFRPNYIARSLVKKQTTTLGIIVPDITNPFFSEIVRGVEDCARTHSYNVFLCNTDEVPEREETSLDSLIEKQVDGIVLCSSRLGEKELINRIEEFSFAILVNREIHPPHENIGTLIFDDAMGTQRAVEYLVQQGHRSISFLAGPQISRSGQKRLEGYYASMNNSGLTTDPALVHHCEPGIEGGQSVGRILLEEHPEVTAILCYNDLVAIGAIQAGQANNRKVPDDLSIIGCDDIPMASLIRPSLTTLQMSIREAGCTAMQSLINLIEGRKPGELNRVFPQKLVIRESTSKAPITA